MICLLRRLIDTCSHMFLHVYVKQRMNNIIFYTILATPVVRSVCANVEDTYDHPSNRKSTVSFYAQTEDQNTFPWFVYENAEKERKMFSQDIRGVRLLKKGKKYRKHKCKSAKSGKAAKSSKSKKKGSKYDHDECGENTTPLPSETPTTTTPTLSPSVDIFRTMAPTRITRQPVDCRGRSCKRSPRPR